MLLLMGVSHAQGTPAVAVGSESAAHAKAESLFLDARKHMDAGNYVTACDELAESERLDPASGTLLNLADCYEKSGRPASAWTTFGEAKAAAERDGRGTWAEQASARALLLLPHVPTLTVKVDTSLSPDGLEVLREGTPMLRSTWGSPILVDPSVQHIEARAPGMKPWTASVRVDSENLHPTVVVAKLEPIAVTPLPAPAEVAPKSERTLERPVGIALLGAAVASLGAGTVLGVLAISNGHEAARRCPGVACSDASAVSLTDDARHEATASTASFIAGGALLLVGGYLFLDAPSPHTASPLRPAVALGKDGVGVALSGAF